MDLLVLLYTTYRSHILSDVLLEIENMGGAVGRLFAYRLNSDMLLTLTVSNVDTKVITMLKRLRGVHEVKAIPIPRTAIHDLIVFTAKCLVNGINELVQRYREDVVIPFIYHIAYSYGRAIHEDYFTTLNIDPDEKFKKLLEMLKFSGWFKDYLIKRFSITLIEVIIEEPVECRLGLEESHYLRGLLGGFLNALFRKIYTVREVHTDGKHVFIATPYEE